jgi:hypothetical protein
MYIHEDTTKASPRTEVVSGVWPKIDLPANFLIVGSTGTGKTFSSTALLNELPIGGRFSKDVLGDGKRFAYVLLLSAAQSAASMDASQEPTYERLLKMARFGTRRVLLTNDGDVTIFIHNILPYYKEQRHKLSLDKQGRNHEAAYNNSILIYIDDCDFLMKRIHKLLFLEFLDILMLDSHHQNITNVIISQYPFKDNTPALRSGCHYILAMLKGRLFPSILLFLMRSILVNAPQYHDIILDYRKRGFHCLFIPDASTSTNDPIFIVNRNIASPQSWVQITSN